VGRGPPWTPEQVVALTEAWAAGLPVEEIAEALGRTPRAVLYQVRARGLRPRKRKTKRIGETHTSTWVSVSALVPPELVPSGTVSAAVRDGLELLARLRAEGIEGTPPEIDDCDRFAALTTKNT
jgi:hypothetical protein